MSESSLIARTHQIWKLYAAAVGLVVAAAIYALPFFHSVTSGEAGIYALVAVLVALVSILALFIALRCPVCGARWMLLAARQPRGKWLSWLRAQQLCPACGSQGERAPWLCPSVRLSGIAAATVPAQNSVTAAATMHGRLMHSRMRCLRGPPDHYFVSLRVAAVASRSRSCASWRALSAFTRASHMR